MAECRDCKAEISFVPLTSGMEPEEFRVWTEQAAAFEASQRGDHVRRRRLVAHGVVVTAYQLERERVGPDEALRLVLVAGPCRIVGVETHDCRPGAR